MPFDSLNWAWSQNIPTGPKFVLVCLADHADEAQSCYPSVARICRLTGLGESTVRRHLGWLEDHGYIRTSSRRRSDGTQTSNRFALLLDRVQNREADGASGSQIEQDQGPESGPHEPPLTTNPHSSTTPRKSARRQETASEFSDGSLGQLDDQPRPGERKVGTKVSRRKREPGNDSGLGLAEYFADKADHLSARHPANRAALAKNFSTWLRRGTTAEQIREMVDHFVANYRTYKQQGKEPWHRFLAIHERVHEDMQQHETRETRESKRHDKDYWGKRR